MGTKNYNIHKWLIMSVELKDKTKRKLFSQCKLTIDSEYELLCSNMLHKGQNRAK